MFLHESQLKKSRSFCKQGRTYVAALRVLVLCWLGLQVIDALVRVFYGFPEKRHKRRVGNVLDAGVFDDQLGEARLDFLSLEAYAWSVVGTVLEGCAFYGSQRRADLGHVREGILEALVRHTKHRVRRLERRGMQHAVDSCVAVDKQRRVVRIRMACDATDVAVQSKSPRGGRKPGSQARVRIHVDVYIMYLYIEVLA